MAYNRKNMLQRIIRIQEITLEHTSKGVTQKWVYENIIYPSYRISFKCYCNYLYTNAKGELNKIDNPKENIPSNQFKLF